LNASMIIFANSPMYGVIELTNVENTIDAPTPLYQELLNLV